MKTSLLSLIVAAATIATSTAADGPLVYFGTYTKGKSKSEGIYVSRLNPKTGELSAPELAGKVTNPSFVAIHPNHRFLYSVSEVATEGGKPGGAVTAFSIDQTTGKLTELNAESSGGAGPCHLSVDPSGKVVIVANYGGGSCASLAVAEDGSLKPASSFIQHEGSSINPRRQKEPHAHSANTSPDGRFAFVADLGIDKIKTYSLDAEAATLTPHGETQITPGSGPRHFAFHPSGKFAWVINELSLSVTGFRYDSEKGTLTEIQSISTIPDADRNREGLSTAEIQAHPSGKFVFGSNRGHDTITVYQVDEATGQLTFVEVEPIRGETPRNFGIDPSGRFLLAAGQASNTISVFAIDPKTGELTDTGHGISVDAPVCARFLPLP
ncbi:MAG: lactonase family protein [Verrucomicrobiae bacterium]|nr:lactonase family protein [Verrucomicrobiae bacterium]